MSTTDTTAAPGTSTGVSAAAFRLEVVVIPVSDVDRAKAFYGRLGWRLDADFAGDHNFRIVQFNPPGSAASIQFGSGVASAVPGSGGGHYLVVDDIEAAHADLVGRGVEVSEIFHEASLGDRFHSEGHLSGSAPNHDTYGSFATFSDPDGNSWLIQEVTTRLPGRIE